MLHNAMPTEHTEVSVKVLFFAIAKELSGLRETTLEVQANILANNLLHYIVSAYSLQSISQNVMLAVNEEWIDSSSVLNLKPNDIIAVIPPLSGGKYHFFNYLFEDLSWAFYRYYFTTGPPLLLQIVVTDKMNNILLTHDPLDVNKIYNSVGDPSCGAISLFVGTTRDNFEGKPVVRLEYEAYESMAVKSLEALANDLRLKYTIVNIAIHHRLGLVPVSEASVVIAVSSAHRQASLEAVAFAIDALKANVPIFKKEVYGDEASQWKKNSECDNSDGDADISCFEVKTSEPSPVDRDLVQITAGAEEINRRIMSFMKRKREELDINNLQDFCFHGAPIVERENSCARVDAFLIRQKNSKSHLKVYRVENSVGPQVVVKPSEEKPLPTQCAEQPVPVASCPTGAEERLDNAERFLGLATGSLDVFSRLKAVEDRILYLESVSPEYFNVYKRQESGGAAENKKITNQELKAKVAKLELKLQNKFNQ